MIQNNSFKTKKFIKKSKLIHGDKYDYSKVEYIKSSEKVIIICPEHGEFEQLAGGHLRGQNCKKCYHKSRLIPLKDWIEKSNLIHNNKYDYSKVEYKHSEDKVIIICPEHGEFIQRADAHKQGSNCFKCGKLSYKNSRSYNNLTFIEKAKQIHNNKYDYSKVEYINSKSKIIIICPEHGEFEQLSNSHLQNKGCSKCINIISKSEQEIVNYMKELGIDNIEQSNRSILQGKELDIYLTDYNLAIEFNGLYWHDEYSKPDNYHLLKTNECLLKGIQLIHIFEDEWINKKDIVKSRIINLVHKIKQNRRIYARKCFIKEIDISTAKSFTERNHLQGFIDAKVHLGLFFKQDNKEYLVSYMSFGNLQKNLEQKETNDKYYELLRFCNVITYIVIGGASKLLKYFEKHYSSEKIFTYVDRRWSNGNLYNQLGFTLTNKSKPNYYYIEGMKRYNRYDYEKNILISKYNCKPEMTEKEFCRDILGLTRIYDSGNLVYEK